MSSSECEHLSLQETWSFILSLEDTSSTESRGVGFLSALWCSAAKLMGSLWSTTLHMCVFLYYVLVGIVKLGTGAMPHVLFYGAKVVAFHKEQLGWLDLLCELILFLGLAIFYIYQTDIMAYIHKIEKSMAKSSRLAKSSTQRMLGVAPHIAFFFISLLFAFFGRKFLAPISSLRVLPLFSLAAPVLTTCWTCLTSRYHENEDFQLSDLPSAELQRLASEGRTKLLLWIVLMVYHGGATLLSLIPFSQYLLGNYLPFVRQISLLICLFIQISPLFCEIVFEVASPILAACADRIPSSSVEEERGVYVLTMLRHVNVITDRTEAVVKALCVEGTSLVIMLFFCMMPTRISNIGVVILAMLLPGIRGSLTVRAWDQVSPVAPTPVAGSRSNTRNTIISTQESESSSTWRSWDSLVEVTRGTSGRLLAALRVMSPTAPTRTAVRFEPERITSQNTISLIETTQISEQREPREAESAAAVTLSIGAFASGRKVRKNNTETCAMIRYQTRWLEYFVCLGTLWWLRCYGIQLWPSLTMALCWWLSHSLWAGATKVAVKLVALVDVIPEAITPRLTVRLLRSFYELLMSVLWPSNETKATTSAASTPRTPHTATKHSSPMSASDGSSDDSDECKEVTSSTRRSATHVASSEATPQLAQDTPESEQGGETGSDAGLRRRSSRRRSGSGDMVATANTSPEVQTKRITTGKRK